MFAPTKTHRLWHRRVNVNLKRHAIVSTIAETSVPRAVLKKNLNVMLKLNPYAKTARRMSLLAEADRVKSKKENLERKRKPISNGLLRLDEFRIFDLACVSDIILLNLIVYCRKRHRRSNQQEKHAIELIKNKQVRAILGPWTSMQAHFLIEIGQKSRVPVDSYSATSPSLTSLRIPYFFRATYEDSSQLHAIKAIIKLSVIPLNATDQEISVELLKMMNMPTRVFIVHMSSSLASRVFIKAKELGLMKPGYV
ncbi:unnamed protein product [Arabidopsis thaliana]|uniref:Receptor ligand binding region domain-containing protein n=1 Tax=Arabidopsis thaliana TaxID=3702 RepID=A0A654EU31_ARATH|nr:unnamed protein product [Arabidopsis thaliana]